MTPIRECAAAVSMTLEQIVSIDRAFLEVEILKAQNADLKLQLATAQLDLRVIAKGLYVSISNESVYADFTKQANPEVWEEFVQTIRRNKDEN